MTFFILGLMSKRMLVTLPCLLLLLDYWPLGRLQLGGVVATRTDLRMVLLEKLPFFLLSAASCLTTLWTQAREGAMSSLALVSWSTRLANALLSYGRYLGKTFWPEHLTVFYPHPSNPWPTQLVVGVALLLTGVTTLVVLCLRRYRFFGTGWGWYLGPLVPVRGMVLVCGFSGKTNE